MSITFSLYAPNGAANEQFTCRSGNLYTSDAYGVVKSVTSGDVTDLINSGCLMLGIAQARSTFTQTTDPTTANDNTQDYGAGSEWVNTTTGNVWKCISSATGAAQWNLMSQPLAQFRNLADGGDFSINPWQRGTSFTSIANTLTYTADRFFAVGGSSSSISVSQQAATAVAGFSQALQWGRANANSNTAVLNLGHVLENLDCVRLQGQQVTLSFWAKAGANFSAASSALTVALNHSTTAGNDTAAHLVAASTNWQATPTIINATAALTTSFVRYQFTGTCPSNLQQLGLLLSYTPVGTAGANDWVQFMGFQLEAGGSATPFEHRDIEVELALCQRYYFQWNETNGAAIATGAPTTANNQLYSIWLPTPMRTAPSTVSVTVGGIKAFVDGGGASSPTGLAAGTQHSPTIISLVSTITMTAAAHAIILQGSSTTGIISASADF